MKSVRVLVVIALLGVSLPTLAQCVTLEECLEAVDAHYPWGKIKRVEGDLAVRLQKAVWTAYIPQLSMEGQATYQSDVIELDLNVPKEMEMLLASLDPNKLLPQLPHFQYNAYLQASQLIWDGGRVRVAADLIHAHSMAAQSERELQLREVKEAVTELYFSLLLVDKQMELQTLLIEEINRQGKRVESLRQSGMASDNDLDLVHIELLRAEQDSTQLRIHHQTIVEALRIYTGLDISAEENGCLPAEAMWVVETEVARLAPMRPEHLRLDAAKGVAESEWQSYLAGGMPTLALFIRGGYGQPGLNMLQPDPSTYYIAGASLSWNFGRLYDYSAQKEKLRRKSEVIELQRDMVEHKIATELSEAKGKIAQYRALVAQDRKVVELHRRVAERAEQQMAEGALSTTEYLQKMSAYNSAKKLEEVHQIQLVRATYKVKNSLGL